MRQLDTTCGSAFPLPCEWLQRAPLAVALMLAITSAACHHMNICSWTALDYAIVQSSVQAYRRFSPGSMQ